MIEKAKPREGSTEQHRIRDSAGHEAPQTPIQGAKARQGETSGRMRKVVIVSTMLAAAAMLATWWSFVA